MQQTLARRLEFLRIALDKENLRGIVINQSAYIFHLTDWLPPAWASVFLVIGPEDQILVTPFVPEEKSGSWSTVITYKASALEELISPTGDALAALRQALSQAHLLGQPVGAHLDALPSAFALPLRGEVGWHDASNLIYAITSVKDEEAQEAIRQRARFLDRAFEVAAQTIKPGISELQVYGAIYTSLAQSLGGPLVLDCNFGSGERSLGNEPQPTNKVLMPGETVLIDLFPNLGGYVADYTRNFVVGEPTTGQQAQHAVLEKALTAAQAALRPGVKASEIDRLVRGIIEAEGFGEFAHPHHSGHAFGLTIPEPPWIIPTDHTPLRAGMVIAVEPGIYHPINDGMRLEGIYLITEDGCQSLASYPAILTVCEDKP